MKDISLIVYNCHLGLPARRYEDEMRCNKIITALKQLNTGIIGLCEVWMDREFALKIVTELNDRYPFSFYDDGSAWAITHGLLLLSKYPLYNNQIIAYKDSTGWDSFSSKAFFFTCVHLDEGMDFRLVFTHTQADKQKEIRTKQFKQIREKLGDNMIPTLMSGDLNIDPNIDQEEYAQFCVQFSEFSDLYRLLHEKEGGYTYDTIHNALAKKWDPVETQQRLDYIFFSTHSWKASASPSDVTPLGWDYSDHYPLLCNKLTLSQAYNIAPNNVFNNETDAREEVTKEKNIYGNGVSVKMIISNQSEVVLSHWSDCIWDGSFQKNPPPYIEKSNYAGVFAHHPNGEAIGCKVGMVYEIKGTDMIVFMGASAPYVKSNRCYVTIIQKSDWNKLQMSQSLDGSGYESTWTRREYTITGKITNGTTPDCTFTIKKAAPDDNVFNSKQEAILETEREKEKYGTGVSVKLLISTNSGISLEHWQDSIWDGSFQKNPPNYIDNNKWAGIFYHHPNGQAIGCKGGMIYQIVGTDYIIFLGFCAPYVAKNRCTVKIMKKEEWNQGNMSIALDSGSYEFKHSAYGYNVVGTITTGTTPFCTFKVYR